MQMLETVRNLQWQDSGVSKQFSQVVILSLYFHNSFRQYGQASQVTYIGTKTHNNLYSYGITDIDIHCIVVRISYKLDYSRCLSFSSLQCSATSLILYYILSTVTPEKYKYKQ